MIKKVDRKSKQYPIQINHVLVNIIVVHCKTKVEVNKENKG